MILEGQIWDAHTGCPLEGAEVVCAGAEKMLRGYSDEGGYFKFVVLTSGPWQVSVLKSPYTKKSCKYLLTKASLFLHICLTMDGLEDEVVTA